MISYSNKTRDVFSRLGKCITINGESFRLTQKLIKGALQMCREHPGIVLTESDLKCFIYRMLFGRFGVPTHTREKNINSVHIHTEVPWYDEEGRLALRPDITLLDPKHLSIVHGLNSVRLPSKSFEFEGKAIAVEIKFFRSLNGINLNDYTCLRSDIEKLLRLFEMHNHDNRNEVYGILVVLCKGKKGYTHIKELRNEFAEYQNLAILYRSLEIGL